MHPELVRLAYDLSLLVMKTVKVQRKIGIAYSVCYLASVYVEIEELCFNDIRRSFRTPAFTAGKLRCVLAVNSHSEQGDDLVTEVVG